MQLHRLRGFAADEVLIMRRMLCLWMILASSGCSLILDDKVGGFTHNAVPDMELTVIGFDAHVDEKVEVLLVNSEGFVQGHAVVDTLPQPDFTIVLRDAYLQGSVERVDFWADHDGNGELTPPMEDPLTMDLEFDDHMWRADLGAFGVLDFTHTTNFTDLETDNRARRVAAAFTLSITGADDSSGETAEILVFRNDTGIQVGYYFQREITNGTITADLEGIIEGDVVYTVVIVIDGVSVCGEFTGADAGLSVDTEFGELGPCPD